MSTITSVEELETLYGLPGETSLVKEADRLTTANRRVIDAYPVGALATAGPEGLDWWARGVLGGCVLGEVE
jgi:hypothetical protein